MERRVDARTRLESGIQGLSEVGDGGFESRVRPGGEKLIKLGGATETKSLGEASPLDITLRLSPSV